MTLHLDHPSLLALANARHHSRAALAALKAMNLATVPTDRRTELSRIAATLADVIVELTALDAGATLVAPNPTRAAAWATASPDSFGSSGTVGTERTGNPSRSLPASWVASCRFFASAFSGSSIFTAIIASWLLLSWRGMCACSRGRCECELFSFPAFGSFREAGNTSSSNPVFFGCTR